MQEHRQLLEGEDKKEVQAGIGLQNLAVHVKGSGLLLKN